MHVHLKMEKGYAWDMWSGMCLLIDHTLRANGTKSVYCKAFLEKVFNAVKI